MFFFNQLKLINLNLINLVFLILIKITFSRELIDLKKLSALNNIYFIVFDTGLYLYDLNNQYLGLIHQFNQEEYGASKNLINITELNYRHRAYIFCLVNKYLFLFNEYTYEVFNYKINEIIPFQNYYYNIMPEKIENNNISFYIALNKEATKLFFYYYNFNLSEGINEPKEISFNNINIQTTKIRCIINTYSVFIICFYYSILNSTKYFVSTIYQIENGNLLEGKTSKIIVSNAINQIKLAMSYNYNIFVCYLEDKTPVCLINDNSYNFTKINCQHNNGWLDGYKVFYFFETDDFMLISRKDLTVTILNNYQSKVTICKQINYLSPQENDYSIIYNNEYKVVKTETFKNKQSKDIALLANIKQTEYIKETKELISNSQNSEELITNLNDIINSSINLDYIDNKEELIIPKDDMTIIFTSTELQKNNENSNSTIINLGECENILKKFYNISKDSNLYILKIDKAQEGKKYPLIEYEVFYPLTEGKIELLNLSLCDGTNIELSIPITINGTIDKYNPKSDYYNDICSKATSDSNTDIPLKDRRNEFINNNMSLCEENCELADYDYNKKRAKCSCNAKTTLSLDNIQTESKNLLKNFIDIKTIINIEIVKCYKVVFKKNNIKNNYGFFIFILIFILYFICLIVFYCKSKDNLFNEIIQIIKAKTKENRITKTKQIIYIKKNNLKESKKKKFDKPKIIESRQKFESNIIIMKHNKKFRGIKNKNILEYTDSELNSFSYKEALKKDKRAYMQYYCSLLKKKLIILFSFYPNKDYNSQIIKSFLFFFFYASDITINALFFTDDTMHKIYVDSGMFNISYQLPQIIYSFLISYVINLIIEYLSLSEDAIISIKAKKIINLKQSKKIIKRIKMKFNFFFIISFILLLTFWYYISCFCCIYQNTQIHLFKDSLMSFGISLIYPIFINLIPGIFRIPAIQSKKVDKSCMYKFSQVIEFF